MTSINNHEEASQEDVLPTLLFNETYADVHLRAVLEDIGVEDLVAANRCVLASRSPVFHSLLYGGFLEASRNVIDIPGFTSQVLRSVVEYIYTDQPSLLLIKDGEVDSKAPTDGGRLHHIQDLMGLAEAAEYFALPILAKRSLKLVASVMVQHPFQALEYFASRATASIDESQTWRLPITGHDYAHNTHHPFQKLCAVVAVGVAANQVLDLPVVSSCAKYMCMDQHSWYDTQDLRGAFAVMAASWQHREGKDDFASKVAENAAAAAARTIVEHLPEAIDSELVPLATPKMLQQAIQELQRYPYRQFRLLQKWAVAADIRTGIPQEFRWEGVSVPTQSMCHLGTRQRQEIACELSEQFIDKLGCVHQNELILEVQKSGCVSGAQITWALQTQQVLQQVPQWWTARSNVSPLNFSDRDIDRFDCPVLRSGVHHWTIKVEACRGEIWLGVARADNPSWDSLWYTSSGTLAFGIGCGPGEEETATTEFSNSRGFGNGSKVTFKLDLREENSQNGTLSVCIDKGAFQTCFSNLIVRPEDRENGFWPVAKRKGGEMRVSIVTISSE